jgi:hypothetical protein
MKTFCALAIMGTLAFGGGSAFAEEAKKIRDNSFLLEEAYNQEPGVIQHIQAFQHMKDKAWSYSFTEEWPVPRETHQLSFTLPVSHPETGDEAGLGDILLNYRYQLVLKDPLAVSPRLSLVLPTGDEEKGFGSGALGVQVNLPLSLELGDRWVTHWNLGLTHIPRAKAADGTRHDTTGYNYGASVIFLASENFNFLVEAVGGVNETAVEGSAVERDKTFFVNPGVRGAINFKSGLQVVPGLSVPIGVGPSSGECGVFAYLSLEHPLF